MTEGGGDSCHQMVDVLDLAKNSISMSGLKVSKPVIVWRNEIMTNFRTSSTQPNQKMESGLF